MKKDLLENETDTRCYGCEFLTDGGECTEGVDFGEQGCKHHCNPEEDLEYNPEGKLPDHNNSGVVCCESVTLDHFRELRKRGGVIVLTGHGFRLEVSERVYLPELKAALDAFLSTLMLHEIKLFEE